MTGGKNGSELVRGSANAYHDFDSSAADVEQTKAILADRITGILRKEGLSTRKAQEKTGIDFADFARIRGAKLDRFTIDRLMTIVDRLGRQVEEQISGKPEGDESDPLRKVFEAHVDIYRIGSEDARLKHTWDQIEASKLKPEQLGRLLSFAAQVSGAERGLRTLAIRRSGEDAPGHKEYEEELRAAASGNAPSMRELRVENPEAYERIRNGSRLRLDQIKKGKEDRRRWPEHKVKEQLQSVAEQTESLRKQIDQLVESETLNLACSKLRENPRFAGLRTTLNDFAAALRSCGSPSQEEILVDFRARSIQQLVSYAKKECFGGRPNYLLLSALVEFTGCGPYDIELTPDELRIEFRNVSQSAQRPKKRTR